MIDEIIMLCGALGFLVGWLAGLGSALVVLALCRAAARGDACLRDYDRRIINEANCVAGQRRRVGGANSQSA